MHVHVCKAKANDMRALSYKHIILMWYIRNNVSTIFVRCTTVTCVCFIPLKCINCTVLWCTDVCVCWFCVSERCAVQWFSMCISCVLVCYSVPALSLCVGFVCLRGVLFCAWEVCCTTVKYGCFHLWSQHWLSLSVSLYFYTAKKYLIPTVSDVWLLV